LAALSRIDYEPAISAIARLATDHGRSGILWWRSQGWAMGVLAVKAFSSKLAKVTFLASVPKIRPETAIATVKSVTAMKKTIEDLGVESLGEILQELLDALPPEAKKD